VPPRGTIPVYGAAPARRCARAAAALARAAGRPAPGTVQRAPDAGMACGYGWATIKHWLSRMGHLMLRGNTV